MGGIALMRMEPGLHGHVLVVILAALLWVGQAQRVDYPTFKQSVRDSYDERQPFEANLYEVLGILCPESVYCPGDEANPGGARQYRADFFHGLYGQFTSSNRTSETARKARQVVRENVEHLDGCCERCSCSQQCHEMDNCCPVIAKDRTESPTVEQTCIATAYKTDAIPFYGFSYYMVAECFQQNASQDSVSRCKEPNASFPAEIVPIYSPHTNRIYSNKFCALCNDDTNNITSFEVIINFTIDWIARKVIEEAGTGLYAWLMDSQRAASVHLAIPEELDINQDEYKCVYQSQLSETRDSEYQNVTSFLERACWEVDQLYYSSSHAYRNVFCRLLRKNEYMERANDCSVTTKKAFYTSFTSVLNLNALEDSGRSVSTTEAFDEPCPCTQYFDQGNDTCRLLNCPFGRVHVGCECTQLVDMVSGLDIILYTEMNSPATPSGNQNLRRLPLDQKFANAVEKHLQQLLCKQCGTVNTVTLINATTSSDPDYFSITTASIVRINFGFDTIPLVKRLWKQIKAGVSFNYNQYQMTITPGLHHYLFYLMSAQRLEIVPDSVLLSADLVHIAFAVDSYQPQKSRNGTVLSNLLFCTSIALNAEEISNLPQKSVLAGYSPNELRQSLCERGANICLADYLKIFKNSSQKLYLSYGIMMIYAVIALYIIF